MNSKRQKPVSSGKSIPEYQINEDEWFLETLNRVLKAFGVYAEEDNLTGLANISKLKYEAFF